MIKRLALVTALAAGTSLLSVPHADAATTLEGRALSMARTRLGDPYRYGADGPTRFDCSGLTYWAYRHAGRSIPRTAQEQYRHAHHIAASSRREGDLVFFGPTRDIFHVGLYAGHGRVLNANSGSYRGYKIVIAPISEYGREVHYGRIG